MRGELTMENPGPIQTHYLILYKAFHHLAFSLIRSLHSGFPSKSVISVFHTYNLKVILLLKSCNWQEKSMVKLVVYN